ncbi:MAG: PIN domain-containing protein [Alphaproteobacteria bacterium]
MTAVECFLDTNILLYAASRNLGDLTKKTIAIELIDEKDFGLSAQVLQEFYNVATRKADFRMLPSQALEWIENFEEFPCVPTDVGLVKTAAETSARYRISYWDGAIVAAAEALGASTLYSEDLNHGQTYGSVRVVNPFRDAQRHGFQEEAPH